MLCRMGDALRWAGSSCVPIRDGGLGWHLVPNGIVRE